MRADHCRLVAFVNDFGPDMLHRTVANATKSGYLMTGNDPTTGIGDVQASMNVVTYPNPATEMVYVTAESAIRSYRDGRRPGPQGHGPRERQRRHP